MPEQPELSVSTRPAGLPALRPTVFWASCDRHQGPHPYPAHVHAHHELILCRAGTYCCRVGDREERLAAGEALLVQPGDRHQDPLDGPVTYLACGFRLEPGGSSSPALLAPAAPRRLPPGGPAFTALVAAVAEAAGREPGAWGWNALDAACAAWLLELLPALDPALLGAAVRRRGGDPALAGRLDAVLAAEPGRQLGVAALAAAAGLTPRAFATACRAHLGLAPLAARRRARCEAAARLLMAGTPVAETAARLGFANPFHFSRAFRRAFGVPPSDWRR
jgi:AraC-like DNA-binding protein